MASVNFSTGARLSNPRIEHAVVAGLEKPEYEKIRLPALGIFARDKKSPADYMKPWYDKNDPGRANDIYLSVNGSPETHLRKRSGYWRTAEETCDVIAAASADLAQRGRGDIRVSGSIERYQFEFSGRALEDIGEQCIDFYLDNRIGRVNDISYSVNDGEQREYRHNRYWRDPEPVCEQLVQGVREELEGPGEPAKKPGRK